MRQTLVGSAAIVKLRCEKEIVLMFVTMLAAAAVAQAAVPAAPPAPPAMAVRPLKELPNTTISYYDVKGKTNPEIKKALDVLLADPAQKATTQLYGWDVGAAIVKRTEGTKCTVQKATATLTAKVNLPRLAMEAKVAKPVLANWQAFVASVEADAAANPWFLHDRLPGVEKSVVGVDCAVMQASWDSAMTKLKADQTAFAAQRNAAAQAAAAARAAATPVAAPAKEKRDRD
jgi:predicted secreted Zn-dependent protease